MFARQGQLFAGGPAEGFLQHISAPVRLALLGILTATAALVSDPVMLAGLFSTMLFVAVFSYLNLFSILRMVALPVFVFALPAWLAAVLVFHAPIAAALTGCLRVATCVCVSAVFLHSLGLVHISPALRRLGVPREVCLAGRLMVSQVAGFSEISAEMQLAREARQIVPQAGGVTRRLIGGQMGILLARMLHRSREIAMATEARTILDGNATSANLSPDITTSETTAAPLFEVRAVSHAFPGSSLALDDVDCLIPANACTALLGCNGAGKSTMLHLLGGLLTPSQGEVLWGGRPVSADLLRSDSALRQDFRSRVGIVFQDPDCQWLCETVQEEIEFGPRQIWAEAEARDRANHVMELIGVNHLADRPPYLLSGGQKRRVALASVIAMDPDVLLLDEPTLSLDAATTDFLVEWLAEYIKTPGKTCIVATHDLDLSGELCEHAVVLTPCHKLARQGAADEILEDLEFLRQMNLLSRRAQGVR